MVVLVFGCLVLFQVTYFRKARSLHEELCRLNLEGIEEWRLIRDDIEDRARYGLGPDSRHYSDLFERRHTAAQLEKVRHFANAALATGVLGTMVLFVLLLITHKEEGLSLDVSLDAVRIEVILALGSSIIGIICHILILLRVLPRSEQKSLDLAFQLDEKVFGLSREHHPSNLMELPFGDMVRDGLADAFKDAVKRFPEAFGQLNETVASLDKAIENQSRVICEASNALEEPAKKLGHEASKFAEASGVLSESINGIKKSTDVLELVPSRINSALKDVLDRFDGLSESADSVVGKLGEVYQESLTDTVRNFDQSMKQDRKRLVDVIEKTLLDGLREQSRSDQEGFRSEISLLAKNLDRQYKNFGELVNEKLNEIRNQYVDDSCDILKKVLSDFSEQIKQVVTPLSEVCNALHHTTDKMPRAAAQFGNSLNGAAQTLSTLPKQLDEVNVELDGATKGLVSAADRMSKMVNEVQNKMNELFSNTRETVKYLTDFIEELLSEDFIGEER